MDAGSADSNWPEDKGTWDVCPHDIKCGHEIMCVATYNSSSHITSLDAKSKHIL